MTVPEPSADQIATVRRMAGEPTTATYTDVQIKAFIQAYPLPDENGEEPRIPYQDMTRDYIMDAYDDALDLTDNPDWQGVWDLNAAASDIWAEKAGVVAGDFDFSADGGNYSRSQVYEQYMKQSRHFAARRSIKSVKFKPQPHRRYQGGLQ